MVCRHCPRQTVLALLPRSRHPWRRVGEGEPSQGAGLWIVCLIVHLAGRRRGQTCNYIPSHGLWLLVWLGSGTLKEWSWKVSDKQVWERGSEYASLKWWKRWKCLCHAHQRLLQWRRILIINWIVWPILRVTASFQAISVIAQWAHEEYGSGDWNGGSAWTQQHGLLVFKANLATAIQLSAQFASCRDITEPPMWEHSWGGGGRGRSANCLVAGWLRWTTSIIEGAAFCSYWNRHTLDRTCLPFT